MQLLVLEVELLFHLGIHDMLPVLTTLLRLFDAFFITYPSQQSLSVKRESLLDLMEIVVVLSVELHHTKLELSCIALPRFS